MHAYRISSEKKDKQRGKISILETQVRQTGTSLAVYLNCHSVPPRFDSRLPFQLQQWKLNFSYAKLLSGNQKTDLNAPHVQMSSDV